MLQVSSRNPVFLTPEGLDRLETELVHLTQVRRREIGALIGAAAEDGDLAENAAYAFAKSEQAQLENHIGTVRDQLHRAVLIEHQPGAVVALGSNVTIVDEEEEETYTIVGSLEAAPTQGRISNESPLGRMLISRRPGDRLIVETPGGARRIQILAVR